MKNIFHRVRFPLVIIGIVGFIFVIWEYISIVTILKWIFFIYVGLILLCVLCLSLLWFFGDEESSKREKGGDSGSMKYERKKNPI